MRRSSGRWSIATIVVCICLSTFALCSAIAEVDAAPATVTTAAESLSTAPLLSQTFDVTKYGAIGDGISDSTSSVAAAVTAMLQVQTPGSNLTLLFPAGHYVFNSAPQMQAYIYLAPEVAANPNISYSLVGGGASSTLLQCYACFYVANVLSFSVSDIAILNHGQQTQYDSLQVEQVNTVSFDRVVLTQDELNNLLTLSNITTVTLSNFNATHNDADESITVGALACVYCESLTITDFNIMHEDVSIQGDLNTVGIVLAGGYSNVTLARGTISGFVSGITNYAPATASGEPSTSQVDVTRSLSITDVIFFDFMGAFFTEDLTTTTFQNCSFSAPDLPSVAPDTWPNAIQIVYPKATSASNLLPITVQDCSFTQMTVAAIVQNALFNMIGCTLSNFTVASTGAVQYSTSASNNDRVENSVNFIQSVFQNNVFEQLASPAVQIISPTDLFPVNLSGNVCTNTLPFDTSKCVAGVCVGSNNTGCGGQTNAISES